MGSRIFCDNCGNTILHKNPFIFGPKYPREDDEDDDYTRTTIKRKKKSLEISREEIDLCPHCEPIWLERVKKLTEVSKPDV